jgi:hypothetical protein
MSKDLFLEHRIREIERMDSWTKRETVNKGKQFAIDISNNGEVDPKEALAKLTRFKDLIESSIKELKPNIVIDKEVSINGVKLSYIEGGKILDYSEDAGWLHLKAKLDYYAKELKSREDQLKRAHELGKSYFDHNGEEIKPIPVKSYRKSYIKITY